MSRIRSNRSIIWNRDKLQEAVSSSSSIKEALMKLGLRAAGGNYKQFNRACKEYGIEPPAMPRGDRARMIHDRITIPLEKILIEGSTYVNRTNIKKRCYAAGLLKEECSACGLGPTWNGSPIVLQLEHVNGIFNDHRLENLAILCPNCHSQTDTFAGRSPKK